MDNLVPFPPLLAPTAQRPLLGLTVLVVEDSRYACEALRLLCVKSGARIRRADCLAAARKHLSVYRPSVLIVDLGLPDGSGLELIRDIKRSDQGIDVILATSGDDNQEFAAIKAGAAGFLAKPLSSIATFQQAILEHLPSGRRPPTPRAVTHEHVTPDTLAYQDDLKQAVSALRKSAKPESIHYLCRFISGIARIAGDDTLQGAAERLTHAKLGQSKSSSDDLHHLTELIEQRLKVKQTV